MKLNFGSEIIMIIFILGLTFFTVIQPTFYPSAPTTTPAPPAGGPTPTPTSVETTPTLTPTPPITEPTATPTSPAGGQNPAFFTIDPLVSTIQKGQALTLTFTLNTGDFEIDSVDLVFNFDPQFLQVDSINPGAIFPQYPVQRIENNKVIISAAGKIQDGQVIGFKGKGEYIKITFRTLEAANSTQISFNQDSAAASTGQNQLDLTKCQPGNYQITD